MLEAGLFCLIMPQGLLSDGGNPRRIHAEHLFGRYLLCLLFGELTTPSNTLGGISPLPRVVVFLVASCLLVSGVAPIVPTFGTDMSAQTAVHEQARKLLAGE